MSDLKLKALIQHNVGKILCVWQVVQYNSFHNLILYWCTVGADASCDASESST